MTDLKTLVDNQVFIRLSDTNYISTNGKLSVLVNAEYMLVLNENEGVAGILEGALNPEWVMTPERFALLCGQTTDFRSIRIEEKKLVLETKDVTFIYRDCPPAAYLEIAMSRRIFICIVPTSFKDNAIKALLWKP